MKWAYYIKYKIKTVAFLTAILLIILSGNIMERSSYSTLDSSIESIYKDRLEVSQYIYEISNSLYQKKMLVSETLTPDNKLYTEIQTHNQSIDDLIHKYETTFLTAEEEEKWILFKSNIASYNAHEQNWLNNATDEEYLILSKHFNAAVHNLNELSYIQVGEGHNIFERTHHILNSQLVFSSFEISLLIVLGIFCLIIISAMDNRIFPAWQNKAMN